MVPARGRTAELTATLSRKSKTGCRGSEVSARALGLVAVRIQSESRSRRTLANARARTMRSAHAFRPAAKNRLDGYLSDTDLLKDPLGLSTSAGKASAPSREPQFDVDLFVIGGGSGGIRAARVASGHGAKVMLAEEHRLGGTCVIRGCVPKKLFVYASRFSDTFDEAAEFGWRLSVPHFDWPSLVAAKDREIARLEGLYGCGQERAGVEVVTSRAVLEDARSPRLG